jgi:hypothetical protein
MPPSMLPVEPLQSSDAICMRSRFHKPSARMIDVFILFLA